jgi:toxin ParE1/3/4
MPLRVNYQFQAENDLQDIFTYIMEQSSSADTASRYTDRIKSFCDSFVTFPRRGTQRDDLYPGIRLIGFERRVTIAFIVNDDTVQIVRIFYAGRDVDRYFHEPRVEPDHDE